MLESPRRNLSNVNNKAGFKNIIFIKLKIDVNLSVNFITISTILVAFLTGFFFFEVVNFQNFSSL